MSEFKSYVAGGSRRASSDPTKRGGTKSWAPVTANREENEEKCCCPCWVIALLIILGLLLIGRAIWYFCIREKSAPTSSSSSSSVTNTHNYYRPPTRSGPSKSDLENQRLKAELERKRKKKTADRLRREEERRRQEEAERKKQLDLKRHAAWGQDRERLKALEKKNVRDPVRERINRINSIVTRETFKKRSQDRNRKRTIPLLTRNRDGSSTLSCDPRDLAGIGKNGAHFWKK